MLGNPQKTNFTNLLRDKFFKECTDTTEDKGFGATRARKVNMTPHDVFEWFKQNVK